MKKSRFFILLAVFASLFSSCKPEEVAPEDVIYNVVVSDRNPFADGSVIDLSAKLNKYADAEKRNVVFKTSAGVFLPGNDTIITQKAVFENSELVARVKLKLPASPGKIYFIVQPEIRSAYGDYIIRDSITTKLSVPTSLNVIPSSFSVLNNYAGEVQVSAVLKNGSRNVSANSKVVFEDYLPDGTPVGGRYRLKKDLTDASSTVSTYYSPGHLAPGTSFFIKCTYIDLNNNKTLIRDSCLISIVQP